MRKLWRHEWKYHLFFILLLLLILVVDFHHHLRSWMFYYFVDVFDIEEIDRIWEIVWMFGGMEYQFMERVVTVILVILLIKKGFIYYIEKNTYGRDFFQSLPIRKNERFCFHLMMDVFTMVIAVIAMGIYEPVVLQNLLAESDVVIPWLFSSYISMMILNISYALMLLGALYVVESFFVNGPMKLVGICGIGYATTFVLDFIFNAHKQNLVVRTIYGFISRASVGGNYYKAVIDSSDYGILDEPGESIYYIWTHEQSNPDFLWRGEQLDYSLLTKDKDVLLETMTSLNQLYDLTHVSSYIWHVVGYLAIAAILIMVAKYLVGKQEASKEGFYFGFVKYMVSGCISVTFYVMLMMQQASGWHHVMCILATIVVFVILLCLLDVDRMKAMRRCISGVRINQ